MIPAAENPKLKPLGAASAPRHPMRFRTLVPFLVLAFGLSWGTVALAILFPAQIEAIFGPVSRSNPLFYVAVYAPAISGVFLVWWHYGLRGLGSYFRRLTLWRMPLVWWAFLLVGIPAFVYLAAWINGTIEDPFPFSPWYDVVPSLGSSAAPRSDRGVRLARCGAAAAATSVCATVGWPARRRRLGILACALLLPQRHATKRLGARPVPAGGRGDCGDPDAHVQRGARQHSARRPVPLSDGQQLPAKAGSLYPAPTCETDTIGWLTAALEIFTAAFMSALVAKPHATQRNRS
jgi:hypothetical protein